MKLRCFSRVESFSVIRLATPRSSYRDLFRIIDTAARALATATTATTLIIDVIIWWPRIVASTSLTVFGKIRIERFLPNRDFTFLRPF